MKFPSLKKLQFEVISTKHLSVHFYKLREEAGKVAIDSSLAGTSRIGGGTINKEFDKFKRVGTCIKKLVQIGLTDFHAYVGTVHSYLIMCADWECSAGTKSGVYKEIGKMNIHFLLLTSISSMCGVLELFNCIEFLLFILQIESFVTLVKLALPGNCIRTGLFRHPQLPEAFWQLCLYPGGKRAENANNVSLFLKMSSTSPTKEVFTVTLTFVKGMWKL